MRNYVYVFGLCLIAICLGCKKEIDRKRNNLTDINDAKISEKSNGKVIITGTSDDPIALEYINIINNAYLFSKNDKTLKKYILNDTINIEIDLIFKSQSFDILIFGNSSFYRSKIYIGPGETVSFKIRKNKLLFHGKNSAYNNFYILLAENTSDYQNTPYKGNIQNYKKNINEVYNEKLSFLNKYSNNEQLSKEQAMLLRDMLKYEYLNNLINPISVFDEKSNRYIRTQEGVLPLIENEYNYENQLFNFYDYVDEVKIEDFKKPNMLNNSSEFKNSFDAFIRYYFASNDYLNYTKESFLQQKQFIQENFDDELECYAIARMLREYDVRGFGYSTENSQLIKNTIAEYDSFFSKKPSYKNTMDGIKSSLNSFNFKLSDLALDTKLMGRYGDTTTLNEIFNRSSKRIRVIDFWASWCPPLHFRNY
jgi:hypothetical protein